MRRALQIILRFASLHPYRLIALSVCLALPSLISGYAMDDFWLLAQTGLDKAHAPEPWDLYKLWPITTEHGEFIPWAAHPDAKLHLLRPLASLSLWIDLQLSPTNAWWPQIVNILWWGLCLLGVMKLFRALALSPKVAALALFIYALDDAHAMAIAWPSSRHLLMSTTFFCFAWSMEIYARNHRSKIHHMIAFVLWCLSLLSGESAIALLGFMLVRTILDSSVLSADDPMQNIRARFKEIPATWIFVSALWIAVYIITGFGASHQDLYVTPWHDPLRFLELAPARCISILLAGYALWMSDPTTFFEFQHPQLSLWATTISGIVILGVLTLWRKSSRGGQMRELAPDLIASAGMAVVHASGPVQDRVLMTIGIPVSIVLARVVVSTIEHNHSVFEKSIGRTLIFIHLILSPVLFPLRCASHRVFADIQNGAAWSLASIVQADSSIVFLTSPGPFRGAMSLLTLRGAGHPTPLQSLTLSSGHAATEISRPRLDTICVTSKSPFFETIEDRILRGHYDEPLPHTAMGSGNVRLHYKRDEDSKFRACARWAHIDALNSSTFVIWTDQGFVQVSPPREGSKIYTKPTPAMPQPLKLQHRGSNAQPPIRGDSRK